MTDQLQLFADRLPPRPYCTDDLENGLCIRSARQAAQRRYIQVNPPWLRAWIVLDVDRPGAALAWDDCGLPEPAWTAMNPVNGHAHLSWGLDAPVLLGQHDRAQPMRYLAAVEEAMRAKIDGDEGYSGLIAKNPKHSSWRVMWGRRLYDLAELSEYLDLPRYIKKRRDPEAAGLGRNVATFDHLRYLAYRTKRWWLREHGSTSYLAWQAWLYHQALDYTHAEHPTPLDYREAHWIARSVAWWVWMRFDLAASDKRFSGLQSARGRKKGARRRGDLMPAVQQMASEGCSQREIATACGLPQQTVGDWLRKR